MNLHASIVYYFAGSLGTSVFDMKAVLVGASGGVYALLAAHVANILLVNLYSFICSINSLTI